jgi:hypothetical protein
MTEIQNPKQKTTALSTAGGVLLWSLRPDRSCLARQADLFEIWCLKFVISKDPWRLDLGFRFVNI